MLSLIVVQKIQIPDYKAESWPTSIHFSLLIKIQLLCIKLILFSIEKWTINIKFAIEHCSSTWGKEKFTNEDSSHRFWLHTDSNLATINRAAESLVIVYWNRSRIMKLILQRIHLILERWFSSIWFEAWWKSALWKWDFQGKSKLYSQNIHDWKILWEILIQICWPWIGQQNILRQLESSIIIFWAKIMKQWSKRASFC
jgi:hypothetical protein